MLSSPILFYFLLGNKTSHVAALLKSRFPKARVFGLDRDEARLAILKNRVLEMMGAKSVVPMLQDFLALSPQDPKMKEVREGSMYHVYGVADADADGERCL